MKKLGFVLPVAMVFLFSMVGTRLIGSGAVKPTTMIAFAAGLFLIMFLVRPKQAAPKPAAELEKEILGDYAADAFAENPQLAAKFQAAMKDYRGNMPKAALSKLQKMAPLCSEDKDVYAVAMASAMLCSSLNKPKEAVREYIRALNIHPTSELAQSLGSSYQRLGELDKARDSYQYAMDLNPSNLEALSAIATTYVADGMYQMGLNTAMEVLEKNESHASSLATAAICHGLLGDPLMSKHYTDLAVANGYNKNKIAQTIDALKKR